MTTPTEKPAVQTDVNQFVAEADTGGRRPVGAVSKNI
jgi:hypothetical protein